MNRKAWSNEEKTAVVLELLRGEESVSGICARHGVAVTQAYKWRDQFVAGGRESLKDKRTRNGREPLAEENRRLKELAGHQALVIDTQKKLGALLGTE